MGKRRSLENDETVEYFSWSIVNFSSFFHDFIYREKIIIHTKYGIRTIGAVFDMRELIACLHNDVSILWCDKRNQNSKRNCKKIQKLGQIQSNKTTIGSFFFFIGGVFSVAGKLQIEISITKWIDVFNWQRNRFWNCV